MKEYVAKVGGRYTYKADWENLQSLALSVAQIFDGCNDFIISGCEITGPTGNKTIAPGYIWMNGKVRYFDGKTGVDLSDSNYLIEQLDVESVKYSGGATKEGVNNYKVVWGDTTPPSGTSYIIIPASGKLPDINDEFFGKYAILSNTASSKQTINKLLQLNDALDVFGTVNIGNGTNASDMNINRVDTGGKLSQFKHSINASGVSYLQHFYDGGLLGEMSFDPVNEEFKINIGTNNQITITDGSIVLRSVTSDGNITNGDIVIENGSIDRFSGDSDTAELRFNFNGFQGGNTRFRDTVIYDGKGSQIVKFEGATRTLAHYGVILQNNDNPIGLKFQDTLKTKTDIAYKKAINWHDKNGDLMFSFGYITDTDNDVTIDNEAIGDVVIKPKQYLKSSKPIMEEGTILSNKYADKSGTQSSIDNKVDKVTGKALSKNDFTDALKSKLDGINTAVDIAAGDGGYATGDQVHSATENSLNKNNNLSELTNVGAARTKLEVYSKAETDNKYLHKSNNLSDVDAIAARTNLNVPKVGDSHLKSEVYEKSEVYTKTESNNLYEPNIQDSGWIDCLNPDNTPQFNIKIRRYGNVVNIIGSAQKMGDGKIWFAVPASIPAPPFDTGQVLDVQADDGAKYNRGMIINCQGGSKNFYVRQEDGAKTILYANITYLV